MLFENFDFNLLDNPDFKEDSVREVLILPILHELGYNHNSIVRSKTLEHPFVKIGSKKRNIHLVPDYLFKVGESYAWVLDAKAPNESIHDSDHIEQVYSYAIHPEVRTKFFALCNGKEFILFRDDEKKPLLFFPIRDIEHHWQQLESLLSPSAFQTGKQYTYTDPKSFHKQTESNKNFNYLEKPFLEEINVKKRAAKRHFGVHGYFTRQAWNVVQEYIRHFSQRDDVVLDPFGGSGVTAIEALMIGRKAIHIDINPMSVFMVEALIAPVKISDLKLAFEKIKAEYEKSDIENFKNWDTKKQKEQLKKHSYPTGFALPKGSDVKVIEDLFSDEQKAKLAFVKHLIKKLKIKIFKNHCFWLSLV
ncbi:DNA methyltransferase [Bernardetia sp.]|uniref:DNA methyltransferase n=1 Tax=Bernardetia sp. TaxID=1937974 RepID=UPI0025C48A3C|nr:DNA methyltransferase [Bernardetia sp.]